MLIQSGLFNRTRIIALEPILHRAPIFTENTLIYGLYQGVYVKILRIFFSIIRRQASLIGLNVGYLYWLEQLYHLLEGIVLVLLFVGHRLRLLF